MKSGMRTVAGAGAALIVVAAAFWAGTRCATKDCGSGGGGDGALPGPGAHSGQARTEESPVRRMRKNRSPESLARVRHDSGKAPPDEDCGTDGTKRDLEALLDDLDAGRIGERDIVRRLKAMARGDDRVLLADLRKMSESPDAATKRRAFAVVAAAYGLDGKPPTIDLDAEPGPEEIDRDAWRTHELVEIVGAGLVDPDASVRDAAYDTYLSLDADPSFVLSRQILMGGDHDLKMRLMETVAGKTTTFAVGLSLDALGNADDGVRAAAFENLAAVVGRTFSTPEEARGWWEENCDDFIERANAVPGMDAATVAEETSETEENQQNNNQEKEQKDDH